MTRLKFIKNWKNMPAELALSNIKYLQENYKKYPIYFLSGCQIKLGEDILITAQHDQKTYKNIYTINGFDSPIVDKELQYLWMLCTDTATYKDKMSHWCEKNAPNFVRVTGCAVAATALVSLGVGTYNGIKNYRQEKADKLEQYVQKRIQEHEASKTINYQDTINQKTR